MEFVQIEVKERPERGTRQARSLRGQGLVPAVLYGLGRPNMPLVVSDKELERFGRTGSRLVELKMGDKARFAIVREVQHDPISDAVLHVDFVRIDKDVEVDDRVPVVYKGRAKGAAAGGVFQAVINDVKVRCRPLDLPREIAIDVGALEIGQALHAKDLVLPAGVTLLDNPEELIAHVVLPRVEAPPTAAPAEAAAAAEPELIRKAAAPEEEGEEGAAPKAKEKEAKGGKEKDKEKKG